MASRTYHEQVIVLKKTKLKESDLILTLLAADGRQIRAVAKGARKPSSSFASRLDVFSNAWVLFASGRSLDIVKEARIVDAHEALRHDTGLPMCAAPMADLLAHATQDALPVPRLFDMTQAALAGLPECTGTARLQLCAAFLWKACALLGFRPMLAGCVECGRPVAAGSAPETSPTAAAASTGEGSGAHPDAAAPVPAATRWFFSPRAGGVLCSDCALAAPGAVLPLDASIAQWAETLIGARFAQVQKLQANEDTALAVLRLVRDWTAEHIGRLKSLELLLSMKVY